MDLTQELFNDLEDFYNDILASSDISFDEGIPLQESTVYLSNVDYSLNSPLISDEIDEFQKFLRGEDYRQSWNMTTWESRKRVLNFLGVPVFNIRRSTDFHKWFGQKNLCSAESVEHFTELLNLTQNDAEETYPIVDAFLRGWIGKEIPLIRKDNLPHAILKWGAYFLDFHIMTLLLNAVDTLERSELSKLKNVRLLSTHFDDCFLFTSENFGEVITMKGFIYLYREGILLDRNMTLMCKDTYIARFQTLLSMINRVDQKFEETDWRTLGNVYSLGDRTLVRSGNLAFDALKMIEPMCLLRSADIAREFRPLIPEFPSFRNHILNTVETLSATLPLIREVDRLISSQHNIELILTIFGSFRHWGHPFINYLDGLETLHNQVNLKKYIDSEYAGRLGSDLAYIVLEKQFKERKKWYVDLSQLDKKNALYAHIKNNIWPTPKQIKDFGDHWHQLPLIKCFDIPDMIDPSQIYSDKSHSMNKTDVIHHVRKLPNIPIPSKKVIETYLKFPATNWGDFFSEIETKGLSEEDLIIGLKGKERELKIKGRFFSLMSWRLREYFVSTEYLIKTHYVPLFKGLTMADDLTTVIKKMMDNTSGQGNEDYSHICIANHIDYQKWNNHQRHEANEPVFTVMGKFLGYPHLIARTHEFFQKSLIYYNGRPDLMKVEGDELINKTTARVVWNGQKGGLEGLRQKGWSVVNLLVIRRESSTRNTNVKVLAQGDNQVICTQYQLQKCRNEDEICTSLNQIYRNNELIMEAIEFGIEKLGLIINQDETLQSADFLVYGKVPIFRGNIKGLEGKRWSRVTCVTNDQLPNLANTLSTISSNALTVAHFDTSPINTIIHYNFLGNFGRRVLEIHNPALKSQPRSVIEDHDMIASPYYKAATLYLDPCLGGACGMSLTRFLIRGFPDPVTESLSFWKIIYHYGHGWVKDLALKSTSPLLGSPSLMSFKKLMEDPLSLNIPGGVNPNTVIKEEIRHDLIRNSATIRNEVIRSAVDYMSVNEDRLYEFLRSIQPMFPRFLSEYMASTYLGITQSLVNLFQNSKTIRTVFSRKIDKRIKKIIIESELQTLKNLVTIQKRKTRGTMYSCSSTKADNLREQSWGRKILGATIPHPIELLGSTHSVIDGCKDCNRPIPYCHYISTLIPNGLDNYRSRRGIYKAYLGSRTSESTSVLQSWEKETKVNLIRRAVNLRGAIGWFIEPNSNLADTIIQNLTALTGEDWGGRTEGFKRTGSALHRFSCSRQSSAGYAAQSPSKLTWLCSTTDTLTSLNEINHDFMHQSLLLFSQGVVAELHDMNPHQGYYHHHINCVECLRKIDNPFLDTDMHFSHVDVHHLLSIWKPDPVPWSEHKMTWNIPLGNWNSLTQLEQSYHIGRAEGYLFGDIILGSENHTDTSSLFPLTIQVKIIPQSYLRGLLDGLVRSAGVHCIFRRSISELKRPREALLGVGLYLIEQLSKNVSMLTLWRYYTFESLFFTVPHKIPQSYPLNDPDLGLLGRNYLRLLYGEIYISDNATLITEESIWIFSDINHFKIIGLLSLSTQIIQTLYTNLHNQGTKKKIRQFKNLVMSYKDPNTEPVMIKEGSIHLRRTDDELRHATKLMGDYIVDEEHTPLVWSRESVGNVLSIPVNYTSENLSFSNPNNYQVPRIQNPLISSLRLFQYATGSHYKIRSIIKRLRVSCRDVICGGDGSGGISAYILRMNAHSRVIFNSFLDLRGVDLRGTAPSPPSAINSLEKIKHRCVNLKTVWENPSDLSDTNTWEYFLEIQKKQHMLIDLIILDIETNDIVKLAQIEHNVANYVFQIFPSQATLIYKTYLDRLLSPNNVLLTHIGTQFSQVLVTFTEFTSSQSSEVYLVFKDRRSDNLNLFPDISLVQSNLNLFPVFRTCRAEFERALNLLDYNMMAGVPHLLVPNPFIELSMFLESLQIDTGIAAVIIEVIKFGVHRHPHETPFILFMTAINNLLHLVGVSSQAIYIPSDKKVYSIGILTVGFLNWLALCERNYRLHHIAQMMISQYFPFSWRQVMIMTKKRTPSYYPKFSVFAKYKHSKNFHLDAKLSKIGTFTRLLIKIFGVKPHDPDLKILNSGLSEFNKKLTANLFHSRFDLFLIYTTHFTLTGSIDYPQEWTFDENLGQEGAYVT